MRTAIALLCLLFLLPSCGDDDVPPPAPPERVLPDVEELPFDARVAYAIERIFRGPERQSALPMPGAHSVNLALARDDLIDMPDATLAALADPALIERGTGPSVRDRNPWHGILSVT